MTTNKTAAHPASRPEPLDVAALAVLLRETEEHHGVYEAIAPKHHWSTWYAAYLSAREQARTVEQAKADAGRYVEEHASGGGVD